ncbi:MAG: histidinol dehydrogenase [Oceanococcaceae bacterium]
MNRPAESAVINAPAAVDMRRLNAADSGFAAALDALCATEPVADPQLTSAVAEIIRRIRHEGDEALLGYARTFDGATADTAAALEVPRADWDAARAQLPADLSLALETAAERIRRYAEAQKPEGFWIEDAHGNRFGQRHTPIDRVGVYVPGGKASYPSSVLMNVIPARVAGVHEVIMTAPAPEGTLNPAVLACAAIAGVDRLFAIGGAQAIAALAYGTATVPAVDKIVGPGNAWVAAAKRQVFGQVGIDMIAGPSEVLILADGSAPAEWMAWDLFAQAEHDEQAQSILISPDADYLDAVAAAMARLLDAQPRAATIRAALAARGALIQVADLAQACELANRLAPEHLELAVADPQALLPEIRHAGAIFIGRWCPESFGDYCAGPNHVLPTAGTARFASPLGVHDFLKRTSLLEVVGADGAAPLAAISHTMAQSEGLMAHAQSAAVRGRRR